MKALFARLTSAAVYLPRLLLLVGALSAPALAMPHLEAGEGTVIVDSFKKSNGVGFVLLVSLQR